MSVQSAAAEGFAFSERDFRFLSELVNGRTGIMLPDNKRDMVYARLTRRLRSLGLDSFRAYCELLQSEHGEQEMGNLVNAITTNLTRFFREPHHFDHLKEQVLAPLAANPRADRRVRIWSAGCSTGMEPYSIAMTVLDSPLGKAGWDVKILATDIDTNVLATGRRGVYAQESGEDIPAAYRHKYTELSADRQHIVMGEALRRMITFNPLNLLQRWPMKGPFQAIFCRNVLIYFDKPTQKTLFSRMATLVPPKGWLYIGHSENLFNVSTDFTLTGRTVYQRNG